MVKWFIKANKKLELSDMILDEDGYPPPEILRYDISTILQYISMEAMTTLFQKGKLSNYD